MEIRFCKVTLCLSVLLATSLANTEYVTITTNSGSLRGIIETTNRGSVISRFQGIPYAEPPVGPLRFLPPREHPKWLYVKDAIKVGSACYQDLGFLTAGYLPQLCEIQNNETSEDCLFLNVYVPRNLSQAAAMNESLAVLVWIHGGSFETGAGDHYPGQYLAERGGLIVVTINYRLGIFGLLSTRTEDAPGNVALWDQNMALRWIKDNINHFGGNESKVTIFGESAGGSAVGYHVISPMSKGLFIRAISQSGGPADRRIVKDPVAKTLHIAANLNCSNSNLTIVVQCLRRVSAKTLYDVSYPITRAPEYMNRPEVDGKFLPYHPIKMLQNGVINTVDYIIGSNNYEGYLFEESILSNPDAQGRTDGLTAEADVKSIIKPSFPDILDELTEGVKQLYGPFITNHSKENSEALIDLFGDFTYVAPGELAARLTSRAGLRTYSYMFSHASSFLTHTKGATHAEELSYVFGSVAYFLTNTTHEERALSLYLMDVWTNFSKTGDTGVTQWQQYTEDMRGYIDFRTPVSNTTFSYDRWPKRMNFWNDLVPMMGRENQSVDSTTSGTTSRPAPGTVECRVDIGAGLTLPQHEVGPIIWGLTGGALFLLIASILLFGWTLTIWEKLGRTTKALDKDRRPSLPMVYFNQHS